MGYFMHKREIEVMNVMKYFVTAMADSYGSIIYDSLYRLKNQYPSGITFFIFQDRYFSAKKCILQVFCMYILGKK